MNRLSEFPALAGFFFQEPDYVTSLLRMLQQTKPGVQKLAMWLRAADPAAQLPDATDALIPEQAVRAAILKDGASVALRALLFDEKLGMQGTIELLQKTYRLMEGGIEPWDTSTIDHQFRAFCEREGIKLRQPTDLVRVAITGSKSGPPLFESMEVLGRDRCLARTAGALALAGGGVEA
jgi:glutamyl/glutaminyl-tRNA synthetase